MNIVFVVYVIKSQRSMTRPEVRRKEMVGKICKCSVSLEKIGAVFCVCFYEEKAVSGIRP